MSAYEFPLLIKYLLLSPLRQKARKEIVYRDLVRYDYPTLHDRIGRLGSTLSQLGVRPGDTVAVMDWDSHRYLEAYFAVPMLGAVLHTVNIRLAPEQVLYTLNHAEAEVVLCNTEFLPLLQALRDRLTSAKKLICITDQPGESEDFAWDGDYETMLASGNPAHEFPDFDENTRATIFYTTGTTGLPKGVFFTHRQLVLHTLAVLVEVGLRRDDVYMPITPMFHVHAWGFPYAATTAGLKQVYPGRYAPDTLVALYRDEGVTFSHCVSTIMQMLLSAPSAKTADFTGWRVYIGGGPLPKALCEAALERGIDILGGYGLSETCPVLSLVQLTPELIDGPASEVYYRVKAGLPLPLVDLRIVDADMHDVAHDGIASGEVVVRAPWLTMGYHKDPQASEALWASGYLHTQDIGTIDAHGYVQIADRLKDMIKTGGEWVPSLQIEDIILAHPAIAEAAVVGVEDVKWGQRPMAIVVRREGATVEASEIKAHVMREAERGVISKYAVPEYVRFVDSIDKTSVGKPNKKVLREKYAFTRVGFS
jgi:fatty-acyl-CoA synthase